MSLVKSHIANKMLNNELEVEEASSIDLDMDDDERKHK